MALVSDGSVIPTAMGWGAVVADEKGILATTYGGLLCHFGTSWTAEWLGKVAAVRLAFRLNIPTDRLCWSLADSLSASHGRDGGRPSSSSWLDELRLWYAHVLSHSALQEAYIPAEHDHHWSGLPSTWQATTHDLACKGTTQATRAAPPFPCTTVPRGHRNHSSRPLPRLRSYRHASPDGPPLSPRPPRSSTCHRNPSGGRVCSHCVA